MRAAGNKRIRSAAGATLALITLVATAACGSDGDSSSGDDAVGSYTIGYVYTRISGLDFGTGSDGINAAIKSINDAGGVDGRDLKLVDCNDNGTPDGATTCVQKMVSDTSVVGVTALTLQGAVYARSLASAKLAYMPALPVNPDDSSQAALAFTGGSSAFAAAGLEYLVKDLGATKIAPIGSATTSVDLMRAYSKAVAEKTGAEVVGGDLLLSAGQSDFLPLVARAQDAGVEGAYIGFLAPGDYVPFLQAYKAAGATFDLVGAVPSMTPETIDAFAKADVVLNVVSSFGPADGDGPENVKYQQLSEAAGVPVSEFGQNGYAATLAIKTLLESIGGAADREKLYGAATATDINIDPSPIFPGPITRPLADVEEYASVGNMGAYVGKYEGGKYTLMKDEPVDSSVYFK